MFTRVTLIVFAILALAASSPVMAEIMVGDTVEWMVADSDLIARCRVVAIADEPNHWKRVELAVGEVLKGEPIARITVRAGRESGRLSELLASGDEEILFFQRADRQQSERPPADVISAKDAFVFAEAWRFGERSRQPDHAPIAFTADMRLLRGPQAIEAALRETIAAKATPLPMSDQPPQPFVGPSQRASGEPIALMIEVTDAAIDRELWSGSVCLLRVPLDSNTERLAYGWASSRYSSEVGNAMLVLRYLKSDRAVALMRALLDNPMAQAYGYGGPAMEWTYPIRRQAAEALRDWGVDVPPVALKMPADAYVPVPWRRVGVVATIGVVALTLLAYAMRRRLTRGAAARVGFGSIALDVACALLLLSAALLAFATTRGGRTIFEITSAIGDSQYWAWTCNGNLTVARASQWNYPMAAQVAAFDARASPLERWEMPRLGVPVTRGWRSFQYGTGTLTPQVSTRSYSGPGKGSPYAAARAPLWSAILLLLLVPLARGVVLLRHALRRRVRSRRGQCLACGYDLRASGDRCPECGVATAC